MKKILLLSAIAATTALSGFAFTPQEFVKKGKCWVRVLDSYLNDYDVATGAGYKGTDNIPTYTKGDITLSYEEGKEVIDGKETDVTYLVLTDFFSKEVFDGSNDAKIKLMYNGQWYLDGKEDQLFPTYFAETVVDPSQPELQSLISTLDDDEEKEGEGEEGGNTTKYPTAIPTKWHIVYETDEFAFAICPQTGGDLNTAIKITPSEANGQYALSFNGANIKKFRKVIGDFADADGKVTTNSEYFVYEGIVAYTSGVEYRTYAPDATITETLTDGTENSYNVKFDNNNGSFTIENWGNLGHPFEFSGDLTNGMQSTVSNFTGYYTLNDGETTGEVVLKSADVSGKYENGELFINSLIGNDDSFNDNDIHGTVTLENLHHKNDNRWEGQTGFGTEFESMQFDFGSYMYAPTKWDTTGKSGEYGEGYNKVSKAVLNYNEAKDWTFKCNLNVKHLGYSNVTWLTAMYALEENPDLEWKELDVYTPNYYWIECQIEGLENEDFVESYDLFFLPGADGVANNTTLSGFTPEGHAKQVALCLNADEAVKYDVHSLWARWQDVRPNVDEEEEILAISEDEEGEEDDVEMQIPNGVFGQPSEPSKGYYNLLIPATEAKNGDVDMLKADDYENDANVAVAKNNMKTAEGNVERAKVDLAEAKYNLDQAEGFKGTQWDNMYQMMLSQYNDKLAKYNDAVQAYKDAQQAYSDALSAFNKANAKYNTYAGVFVRANYRDVDGTKLDPTYHALTSLYKEEYDGENNDVVTGVYDIIVSDSEGSQEGPVEFFNLNGVKVNGDNLVPGIYVKRQGNTTSKVLIK